MGNRPWVLSTRTPWGCPAQRGDPRGPPPSLVSDLREFEHSRAGVQTRGRRWAPGKGGGFPAGRGFAGGGDRAVPSPRLPSSTPSLPAADAETVRKMGASPRSSARSIPHDVRSAEPGCYGGRQLPAGRQRGRGSSPALF